MIRNRYQFSDFIASANKQGAEIGLNDTALVLALAERMRSDPKHLTHAIYNDWFWSSDMDAENLWTDAEATVERVIDDAVRLGRPLANIAILNAVAAEWAAYCLIDEQAERRRAEEAADEHGAQIRLRWRAA